MGIGMRLGMRSGLRVELAQHLGEGAVGAGDDGLALRHDPAMEKGVRVRVRVSVRVRVRVHCDTILQWITGRGLG